MSDTSRWIPPPEIRTAIDVELAQARTSGDPWPSPERAHLLPQPWALPHTRVHAAMLRAVLRRGEVREAAGQIVRLVLAGPGSIAGRCPAGNTGRTSVPLTATAELPADIARLLERLAPRP